MVPLFRLSTGEPVASNRSMVSRIANHTAAASAPDQSVLGPHLRGTPSHDLEVPDIRSPFPRVSEIVTHVLPHAALELVFADRAGHVALEAEPSE